MVCKLSVSQRKVIELSNTYSDCGYDHSMAFTKTHQNAVNFTGCLAHVEVTYQAQSNNVLCIQGYFKHNEGCQLAGIAWEPAHPLHPSVISTAVAQITEKASLNAIQTHNHKLYLICGYPEMPWNLTDSCYHWLLKESDIHTVYHQQNHSLGINMNAPDYMNINAWLNSTSPHYNPTLTCAVFHYQAHATKDEHFNICISMEEMKETFWQYNHKSQVILDGTFGICNKKILLFILMGVDEKKKGVPLSFLLFSAPSSNWKICMGYNIEIIMKLFGKWKKSLGSQNGEPFKPCSQRYGC